MLQRAATTQRAHDRRRRCVRGAVCGALCGGLLRGAPLCGAPLCGGRCVWRALCGGRRRVRGGALCVRWGAPVMSWSVAACTLESFFVIARFSDLSLQP